MQSPPGEASSTTSRYTVLAKLATGGMAEIFLARTVSAANVERYVVLKRVHSHRADNVAFVNMFLDEIRLAAQLQHPNIAQVFDTGRLGDAYFFSMEYVHGETVRELMNHAREAKLRIPIGCTLAIVAGAAAGLLHAHDRIGLDGNHLGIVHRDVSPSNLMVTFEGSIKVVDFGVAKASARSTETQTGTVKGKVGYMSPEQCRGTKVDRRCDLFALGIIMWELLTGERLFKRESEYDSMQAIAREPAPAPSARREDVPAELDAIVLKLLAKDPAARYHSAAELLEDIENASVRTGVGMSVAALRRFVRELFGDRPEPWVELKLRHPEPEVVTATGTSNLSADSVVEVLDEQQLEQLMDLSVSTPADPLPRLAARFPRAETSPTVSGTHPPARATSLSAAPPPRLAPVEPEAIARPELVTAPPSEPAPRRGRRALLVVGVLAVLGVIVWRVGASSTTSSAAQVATAGLDAAAPDAAPIDAAPIDAAPIDAAPIDAAIDAIVDAGADPVPTTAAELAAALRRDQVSAVVQACSADVRLVAADPVTCTLAACRHGDDAHARRWYRSVPSRKRSQVASSCRKAGTPVVSSSRPPVSKPRCDPNDPMDCRR